MTRRLSRIFVSTLAVALATIYATRSAVHGEKHSQTKDVSMKYVESPEQLVVELYVRDLKESANFYRKLGFGVVRQEPNFVELKWEDSRLFLEQIPGQPAPPATLVANVRIMVPDVDRYWKLCQDLKLPVRIEIGDRYYGLRDFTVISPDGIGLRFASHLAKKAAP